MEPFSLTWNAKTKDISMSYMGNTATGSFNPDAFWGSVPVYLTISAGLHQYKNSANHQFQINSFTYTDLNPKESAQYVVTHADDQTSTYSDTNMKTWALAGETVTANHTMWNANEGKNRPVDQYVYVPVATINGQAVNPTNVLGTSGGNTAFFNEAKSGGTLNLATFQYPNTNLGLKGEASGGTLSYDYTVPTTGTITGNSVIQDTLVSGAPMMTQYTYANTV